MIQLPRTKLGWAVTICWGISWVALIWLDWDRHHKLDVVNVELKEKDRLLELALQQGTLSACSCCLCAFCCGGVMIMALSRLLLYLLICCCAHSFCSLCAQHPGSTADSSACWRKQDSTSRGSELRHVRRKRIHRRSIRSKITSSRRFCCQKSSYHRPR